MREVRAAEAKAMCKRSITASVVLSWSILLGASAVAAQQPEADAAVATAPVTVDAEELFRVRGISSYPAAERAATIARAIRQVAADAAFDPGELRLEPTDLGVRIAAGERRVMVVTGADGEVEGVGPNELAALYRERIARAVRDWRAARTPEALTAAWIAAAIGVVALILALAVVFWIWRRINRWLEARLARHVESLETRSFRMVDARLVWRGLYGALRLARAIAIIAVVYLFLQRVLARFPWTRGVADRLAEYALGPLGAMGSAFVAFIPNLIFLAILFVVVRWIVRLARVFFDAVEHGTVKLSNFEPEWAPPTYRIVRLLIVAFGVIVAYPLIPGSDSGAFKGVSLFLGIVFSLGSTTAISNIIAGYMLTYRRAFKLGDRIRIGDRVGDVCEMRLQVTHLRTPKNEEIIVPNSTILSSEVINYSTLTRGEGLILHTTVGIGYDTPWRQVEALLLLAARRTPEVLADPAPFVNQLSLGDFAVTYELNAYVRSAQRMVAVYTAMHRNILDVFNEHGVVIMTPAYEGDPDEPKLVPRERWFESPAAPEPRREPRAGTLD